MAKKAIEFTQFTKYRSLIKSVSNFAAVPSFSTRCKNEPMTDEPLNGIFLFWHTKNKTCVKSEWSCLGLREPDPAKPGLYLLRWGRVVRPERKGGEMEPVGREVYWEATVGGEVGVGPATERSMTRNQRARKVRTRANRAMSTGGPQRSPN